MKLQLAWKVRFGLISAASLLLLLLSQVVVQANSGIELIRVYTAKAMYSPHESIQIEVEFSNQTSSTWVGDVQLRIYHLENEVYDALQSVQVPIGESKINFTWQAPPDNFKGYLVEVRVEGQVAYTAIDVSTDWTKYPRYGFFSEYTEAESYVEISERVSRLTQTYHLNAFQLYDWMWRHDTLIQRDEYDQIVPIWLDWSGKPIHWQTIQRYIQAIQSQHAAAMPYTMSYAAYHGYEQRTNIDPAWGMYHDQQGQHQLVFDFGDDDPETNLWLFNPANPQWQNHMFAEYLDAIITAGFDGIHLDQLGQRTHVFDYNGNPLDVETSFTPLINNLKQFLMSHSLADKTITFNMVDGATNGWAVNDILTNANTDFDYSEIWGDAYTYLDLKDFVTTAREKNRGKALVLAAYMNFEENTGERYEAEDATLINVATNHNHSGFTGWGFVDQFGETGDAVQFQISVPEDGRYSLVFRYANDTGTTATRSVYVNGLKVAQIKFLDQNGWDDWEFDAYAITELNAGTHLISLQVDPEDEGYINLDSLTLGTFDENSVRLANAAIAASGAFHIEMGQDNDMLTHPYFPNRSKQMRNSLQQAMKHHYDFITAYQNLLFDHEVVTNDSGQQFVQIQGQAVSGGAEGNTIWINQKRNDQYNILHLINLTNNYETSWRYSKQTPTVQTNLVTKYYIDGSETITNVYMASPDLHGGLSQELSFTQGKDAGGTYIQFNVPELHYWNMIYMKRHFQIPVGGIYEAEEAILSNVGVNNNHAGFTGDGFVDEFYQHHDGVSFTVKIESDGMYDLHFRYSNGGTDATRDIFINGQYHNTLSLDHTGGWDHWQEAKTSVYLREGIHSIVIWKNEFNDHAINLDHLHVD